MKTINGQFLTGAYNMDMVLCFDLTGSMTPYLNTVKAHAQRLVELLHERMEDAGKSIDRLRVRVIGFRDYKYDGKESMVESPFYELPQDADAFQAFLDGLNATGGGDAPENALEALALAMGSDWNTEGESKRSIILLFTDAPALELQHPERTKNPAYPEDMPKDIAELSACWCATNQTRCTMPDSRCGRLLLFAPGVEAWNSLATWPRTWHVATKLDSGLSEVDIGAVADLTVNSVDV